MVYTDAHVFSGIAAVEDGVLLLFAVWHGGLIAVRFDANGGKGQMDNQTFNIGEEQALAVCTFEREGFRFAGWGRLPGGEVVYADGETVADLTPQANATVELYAIWEETGPLPEIDSDEKVAEVLAGARDQRLASHILTVADYNEFCDRALRVKGNDGEVAGAEAVMALEHAWPSYLLGAEALFENEQIIELGGLSVGADKPKRRVVESRLEICVTVKDGEKMAMVDATKVAALFECTDDLRDWKGGAALSSTILHKGGEDGVLLFEVTLGAEMVEKVFVRLGE